MNEAFPDITSFGTLFRFAVELEKAAEQLSATQPAIARKHKKRADQLEQLRRERLNEVVLQPLTTMNGADYLPPADLPADGQGLAPFERTVAAFYDAAASLTTEVLMGVDRTFRKWAAESRKIAEDLEG